MFVFDHLRGLRWPNHRGDPDSQRACEAQAYERCCHPEACPQPSGKGIEQQPAGMRQRKLSSKKRRPIPSLRGPPQQPARGRLSGGVTQTEHEPKDHQGSVSDHQVSSEQAHHHHSDTAEHGCAVTPFLQQARQAQCSHHGAGTETGQGQGHCALGQAKPRLNDEHRMTNTMEPAAATPALMASKPRSRGVAK